MLREKVHKQYNYIINITMFSRNQRSGVQKATKPEDVSKVTKPAAQVNNKYNTGELLLDAYLTFHLYLQDSLSPQYKASLLLSNKYYNRKGDGDI